MMRSSQPFHSGFRAVACGAAAVLALLAGTAGAADKPAVLMEGGGVAVTSADVLADAQRLPPQMHDSFLAKPDNVRAVARNLYVRRIMAKRAQDQGLTKDPELAALAQIAVDKVLSDAYLKTFNTQNLPSDAAIDAQVRSEYQAKKESFTLPEQVHIAHVLVPESQKDAETVANRLLTELRGGADFAEVAKANPGDPGSAEKGGDLGWFSHGKMVPEFEAAAFALKSPGDLSAVVKTKFGYHILKLIGKQGPRQQTLDEVSPQLRQQMLDKMLDASRKQEVEKVIQQTKANDAALEAFAQPFAAKAETKK